MAILSYILRWLPIDRHFPIFFLCMPCLWTIYRSQTHSSLSLNESLFVGDQKDPLLKDFSIHILYHVIMFVHNIYTCTCDISSYLSIVFASKHVQHPASRVDPKKAWERMYIPNVADQHREMEYTTKSAPIPSMGVWHLTFFEAMVNWPLALVFKSYDIHDFTGRMNVHVIHVDGFESLLAIGKASSEVIMLEEIWSWRWPSKRWNRLWFVWRFSPRKQTSPL